MLGGNSKFFWPNCFTLKQSEAYWCSSCENVDNMIFHIMGGWFNPPWAVQAEISAVTSIGEGGNLQKTVYSRMKFSTESESEIIILQHISLKKNQGILSCFLSKMAIFGYIFLGSRCCKMFPNFILPESPDTLEVLVVAWRPLSWPAHLRSRETWCLGKWRLGIL